jgi:hypothetical protein
MYIDPTLFALGVMSATNAIKESNYSNSHTSYSSSHSYSNPITIDEKKLAEEIVKAQERKKLQDAKFEREYEKSLDCYCITYGRDDYKTPKEMEQLKLALRKNKPSCLYHTDSNYKIRIYRPDNSCEECYVKIGEDIVSAYILQLYMRYFGATATDCHREIIDGDICFIIKNEFAEELGWN